MPLYIRKVRGNKGSMLAHESGRSLVPVDNSPAQWACWLALNGERPALDQIRAWIAGDAIPVGLALSAAEGRTAKYRCGLAGVPINKRGWKVCHIEPVGLGHGDIRTLPLYALHDHFRRNLDPGNLFVVPKAWAGLGEMPEMIEAARAALGS